MIAISADYTSCLVCKSLRMLKHTVGHVDIPTRVLLDLSASVYIREGVFFSRVRLVLQSMSGIVSDDFPLYVKERSFVHEQFLHLLRVYSVLSRFWSGLV
jgi:hypothetical protein